MPITRKGNITNRTESFQLDTPLALIVGTERFP